MQRWIRLAVIAASALALLAWLLWPAPRDEGVGEVVDAVAEAAGRRDAAAILERVSESYRGVGGDRRGLEQLLGGWFRITEALYVRAADVRVQVQGSRAVVEATALVARVPIPGGDSHRPEDLLGSPRFQAVFEREGAQWKLAGAQQVR